MPFLYTKPTLVRRVDGRFFPGDRDVLTDDVDYPRTRDYNRLTLKDRIVESATRQA